MSAKAERQTLSMSDTRRGVRKKEKETVMFSVMWLGDLATTTECAVTFL